MNAECVLQARAALRVNRLQSRAHAEDSRGKQGWSRVEHWIAYVRTSVPVCKQLTFGSLLSLPLYSLLHSFCESCTRTGRDCTRGTSPRASCPSRSAGRATWRSKIASPTSARAWWRLHTQPAWPGRYRIRPTAD
eukprot:6201740-Pleurochrysis_carterae.AAC.2